MPETQYQERKMYSKFPDNFLFGAATSSLQVEGSPNADGAGLTTWQVAANTPGIIRDGCNFEVACDHFNRYRDDIKLMKDMGIQAYRFSINWARIFPDGYGKFNQKGMDFYKRLSEELLKQGIRPFATLHHWELPQTLEEQFGGWRAKETARYFGEYAATVGKELSGLVHNYFTVNEISNFTDACYNTQGAYFPPMVKCSLKEERQAVHNALLGHGLAAQALRANASGELEIGLAENPAVYIPAIDTPENVRAANQAFRMMNASKLTAICEGKYPEEYLSELKGDAPEFTEEEMKIIHAPLDFIGLNIYVGEYVVADGDGYKVLPFPEGYPTTQMSWGRVTPEALYWGVRSINDLWGAKKYYITENGCATLDKVDNGEVYDTERVMFLRSYLQNLLRAGEENINIAGYFAWSFFDNFEWREGYTKRFGIVRVDYDTQKRTPKLSAKFYQELIKNKQLL